MRSILLKTSPSSTILWTGWDRKRGNSPKKCPTLKEADVDAKHRKIIWQDAQRLSIAESVKRIHANYPHFALDLIEEHLIGWLEMGFAPPSYSQERLDELDQLTEMWVEDHRR